ncbi:hypothetical protein Poli38472_012669 [Pythium oligandrum]|uniref:Sepiapterin reductase n=1 Tax=Pythium oligandrum TaxID=41045 RepID=A0A8K1CF97_PYTOL|nr:hypothetical protein Poli38472_012669 [Pythium oligandrum]|eukprot:TMW61478.1 hypothetical protein Poli38472_012669 [Pythium oligandrum]
MRSVVVITGASRGYGRCLALDFAREIEQGDVDMYLWARHEADLAETKRLVHEAWQQSKGALDVATQVVDLSLQADYVPKIETLIVQLQSKSYEQVFLVHNAGSLGDLGYTNELSSPAQLSAYWELNVNSVVWFNKRFLDVFGATREELVASTAVSTKPATQATIINISSLCAIEPFATQGLYCTGKAAREMHFRVLAAEQQQPRDANSPDFSKVRVLNYAPGPMDTEMQQTLRESTTVRRDFVEMFAKMKAEGTLIPPATSSGLGVRLIVKNEFESGAHIDYYDIAPNTSA